MLKTKGTKRVKFGAWSPPYESIQNIEFPRIPLVKMPHVDIVFQIGNLYP